jgi:MSHA biogenesis protein MshJ
MSSTWLPKLMSRWRQGRRAFDARLPSERRMLTLALLAVVWFVMDTAWISPAYKAMQAARSRQVLAVQAQTAMQAAYAKSVGDMAHQQHEAQREAENIRHRLQDMQRVVTQQQTLLAPARDMRALLEDLLAENGRLKLVRISTQWPEAVQVGATDSAQPLLYKQGMALAVSGTYLDLLAWLRSVESMPRKLLWDSMELTSDEQSRLTLSLQVHTFSPDRDALEIAP